MLVLCILGSLKSSKSATVGGPVGATAISLAHCVGSDVSKRSTKGVCSYCRVANGFR